ncbi:MAG: hypothetical protein NTW87_12160, partial [Planctomycetota bacterium]|nr:hypothetical protein [Planctomycetota bacterium]
VLKDLAPPDKNGVYVSMETLSLIDDLGNKAAPLLETLRTMPRKDPKASPRAGDNLLKLEQRLLQEDAPKPARAQRRQGKNVP